MQHSNRHDQNENTVLVSLDDINVPKRMMEKLLRKDRGQIEEMRAAIEDGREMFRVILRPNISGGYDIEDGRHRIVAAKLAGASFVEALIVGD
ncbi:MAG: ParB N-terminal domain-containing protein [Candidatus Obscuribacterales bacterium]|nr:ParB N-terminal domain-containing protein [Candidatus Obscuribacterales bacterium]